MKRRAEALVHEALSALKIDHLPPVDLHSVARALGVVRIIFRPLVEEGALLQDHDGLTIVLRRDRHRRRQRFTLAHEIGHILLGGAEVQVASFRSRTVRSDLVEDLCDDVAAELLFPRHWVRKVFERRRFGLGTVRALSNSCDASLSASTVRLNEVVGWRAALLRWRDENNRFRLLSTTGCPPEFVGEIRTVPNTDASLRRVRDVDSWCTLPIGCGDRIANARAEVSVRDGLAIALVDYRQLLPILGGSA